MRLLATLLALLLILPPAPRAESVRLGWTAAGDDSIYGTATSFDLRFSHVPITAANFDVSPRWQLMPAPLAPGTRQSVTVDSLERGAIYYFAIRAIDDAGNKGAPSNLVTFTTADSAAPPDTIPTTITLEP